MLLNMLPGQVYDTISHLDESKYKIRFTKESLNKLSELLDVVAENKKVGYLLGDVSISSSKTVPFSTAGMTLHTLFSTDPSVITDNLISNRGLDGSVSPISILNYDLSLIHNLAGKYGAERFKISSGHENIDKKIKVPNYFLNYSSFCMYLNKRDGHIVEFISIGEHSTLFAVISSNKKLYIRWPVLKSILDRYKIPTCKNILVKALDRYKMYVDAFNSMDPMSGDFMNKTMLKHIIDSAYIDNIHAVKQLVDSSINNIQSHNSTNFKSFNRDVTIYGKVIDRLTYNMDQSFQKKLKAAYISGMHLSAKMALLGWSPSSNKKSSSRGEVWFEKIADIVPSILIYKNIHYKIDKNVCPYKINTLYLSTEGIMHAKGTHPNVSGDGVCMGDLGKINFNLPEAELKDSIDRAARLLDIINYDSAYNYVDRDKLLQSAEKLDIGEAGKEKELKPLVETTIRRIAFVSAEKDNEIESVIVPSEEISVSSQQNIDTTVVRRNGSNENISEIQLPGLLEVDWRKLSEILNAFDMGAPCGQDILNLFKSGQMEVVYLYSIANTERYVSISVSTNVFKKYGLDGLISSDFVLNYYRSKTSTPKILDVIGLCKIVEFLNPVYIKEKKSTSEFDKYMYRIFGANYDDREVIEFRKRSKEFKSAIVGIITNV